MKKSTKEYFSKLTKKRDNALTLTSNASNYVSTSLNGKKNYTHLYLYNLITKDLPKETLVRITHDDNKQWKTISISNKNSNSTFNFSFKNLKNGKFELLYAKVSSSGKKGISKIIQRNITSFLIDNERYVRQAIHAREDGSYVWTKCGALLETEHFYNYPEIINARLSATLSLLSENEQIQHKKTVNKIKEALKEPRNTALRDIAYINVPYPLDSNLTWGKAMIMQANRLPEAVKTALEKDFPYIQASVDYTGFIDFTDAETIKLFNDYTGASLRIANTAANITHIPEKHTI